MAVVSEERFVPLRPRTERGVDTGTSVLVVDMNYAYEFDGSYGLR